MPTKTRDCENAECQPTTEAISDQRRGRTQGERDSASGVDRSLAQESRVGRMHWESKERGYRGREGEDGGGDMDKDVDGD